MSRPRSEDNRIAILEAALCVFAERGNLSAPTSAISKAASVAEGTLFTYFKSKDDLALAAASYWGTMTGALFAAAPYNKLEDPLERLLGYVDFRASILNGELADYTCLLGTLVQETYTTHPDIRAACDQGMSSHIAELTHDVEAAKKRYAPKAKWSAESVGYFIQAVLQGGFIFAKAKHNPDVVRESLAHLRRYLEVLFNQPRQTNRKGK